MMKIIITSFLFRFIILLILLIKMSKIISDYSKTDKNQVAPCNGGNSNINTNLIIYLTVISVGCFNKTETAIFVTTVISPHPINGNHNALIFFSTYCFQVPLQLYKYPDII